MEEKKFNFPTEVVELPSKGLLYPEDSPLSSGTVEMKYMTAKEEDILTNQALIQKGLVLDHLLSALVVTPGVDIKDLIVGDKNALFVAARVLGYGADYTFEYGGEEHTVDLSTIENKPFDDSSVTKGVNQFSFTLPASGTEVTFKLITGREDIKIDKEIEGLKKISKTSTHEVTTRLKHTIVAVNGDSDPKVIREFVDNHLLARDSRALREHIRTIQPDVDLTFTTDSGEEVAIPIGLNFFWPDI